MKVGTTLLAFVITITVLNGLGVSAAAGIDPGTGGLAQDDAAATSQEFEESQFSGIGQQDPGIFGVVVAMVDTAKQLQTLVTKTAAILQSSPWNVPTVIAWGVQIMVDVTFFWGLFQIARAVKF
jgi:hypothetical protein